MIVQVDGTVVELPSLEVVVLATPVSLPPGARFPVYGEPQPYPSITYGRPGGSRNA
jgi:tyrosinase